jgi:hypothetical protein
MFMVSAADMHQAYIIICDSACWLSRKTNETKWAKTKKEQQASAAQSITIMCRFSTWRAFLILGLARRHKNLSL